MEKTYAILWISPETQRAGVGKGRFTQAEAEDLAAELNHKHSAFVHRVVDTASEDLSESLARAKAEVTAPELGNVIRFPDLAAAEAATREEVGL